MEINGLYAGKIQPLEPDGERSAIFKSSVHTTQVNELGLVDDQQADRRVHGGVEKAVHQYSPQNYQTIVSAYPHLADVAVPGSIGENISASDLHETNVNLGDIYRMGSVLLQVSQPRNPCWKINHRYDEETMAKFVVDQQINGWYYRVLESGAIQVGDKIILEERLNDISIYQFLSIKNQHRPELDALNQILACKGLALELRQKVQNRVDFFLKNN